MALEGSFRDFGLADIFQLIGLQKKTGILTVRGEADRVVTISFEKGLVVFADEFRRTEAERLGSILVRTKMVTPEQLTEAMEAHERTLQRLGYVLTQAKVISQEDLCRALQLQMKETVYRVFRWPEGSYHFSSEAVTYDKEIYTPIPAEFLLMEGIRMIDEWPIIEKKITSYALVFEKVPGSGPAGEGAPATASDTGEEECDDLMSMVEEEEPPVTGDKAAGGEPSGLSPAEKVVYGLVDGERSVQDLIDVGQVGEFDTCKILYGFISLNLIREVQAVESSPGRKSRHVRRRGFAWRDCVAAAAAAAAVFAVFLFNPWSVISLSGRSRSAAGIVEEQVDDVKMRNLRTVLEIYYLEKQAYPPTLEKLRAEGLSTRRMIRNGRGRTFFYKSGGKEYILRKE